MMNMPRSLIVVLDAYAFGVESDYSPRFAYFELTPALWERIHVLHQLVDTHDLAEASIRLEPEWGANLPTTLPRLTIDARGLQFVALDQEVDFYYETAHVAWSQIEETVTEAMASGQTKLVLSNAEHAAAIPCVKIEYDPAYRGGDYASFGELLYLPEAILDWEQDGDTDARIGAVFSRLTGLDRRCVIHYNSDERFGLHGEVYTGAKEECDGVDEAAMAEAEG